MGFDQKVLDELLAAAARESEVASVSVSVWDGEREYHGAAGWANAEDRIPATPDTIYAIGSSSKAFTAACIGILADRGILKLDDPVIKHLPDFKMYDPYVTEHLTVRDMLSHRCGLPRHDFMTQTRVDGDTEELVHALRYLKPTAPFRYKFYYQNLMFGLASYLIEKVGGQSYGDFVSDNIFTPLGMKDTYAFGDEIPDEDPRKSVPYDVKDGVYKRLAWPYGYIDKGAGCIYSTTRDMLKWLRFRIHGDESILSDAIREEMQSPQMLTEQKIDLKTCPEKTASAYGMGWFVESYRGFRIVQHGGAWYGYKSGQLIVPGSDIAISVLTNCNAFPVEEGLVYSILDRILGFPDADWTRRFQEPRRKFKEEFYEKRDECLQQEEELKCSPAEYCGTYRDPGYGDLVFKEEGGQLILYLSQTPHTLVCRGEDRFTLIYYRWLQFFEICFKRDAEGRIVCAEMVPEPELPDETVRFMKIL